VLIERARAHQLTGLIAVPAIASLAIGLGLRRASFVGWSIVVLALAYGMTLIGGGGTLDPASLLVAGWLFLCAEAAYLALETGPQPSWPWRHALAALAIAIGSSLAGILLLALNQSLLASGPLLLAGGVIAALTLLALLARRLSSGAS
jgi:hypothetical protein